MCVCVRAPLFISSLPSSIHPSLFLIHIHTHTLSLSHTHTHTHTHAHTNVQDEGDTFDRSREEKITVDLTLSFAGPKSHFDQQKVGLKKFLATTAAQSSSTRLRSFSPLQLEKLVETYDKQLDSDGVLDYDQLVHELNQMVGAVQVEAAAIKTWMNLKGRSMNGVTFECVKVLQDGSRQMDVTVIATSRNAHKIQNNLATALVGTVYGFLLITPPHVSAAAREYIKLELAMHRLTGKISLENSPGCFGAPCSILSVSATTLPIFIRMLQEGKMWSDVFVVKPSPDEYVGLSNDNMEPSGGHFLVPNELTLRNEYWSSKVQKLYLDAHPQLSEHQKEGILLLDAVNPRVTAHTNTKQRAKRVKRDFPRFHIVVLSGTGGMLCSFAGEPGFFEKDELSQFVQKTLQAHAANERAPSDTESDDDEVLPQRADSKKTQKKLPKPSVSDLLTAIVQAKGITNPIAVIGYTRMLRGESFVSSTVQINDEDRRIVPTHMLCGLAAGRSVEDLVQMAGRSTFNGLNVLHRNMGSHAKVKILIQYRDWDLAIAYYRFQDQLFDQLNQGISIQEVLTQSGSRIKYDWQANIIPFMGKRTIGAKKRNNILGAEFKRPEADDVPHIKLMFPGMVWASENANLEYDIHGREWKLNSPISAADRHRMTAIEKDIEEYLYHEKEHFIPVAIILRRALMRVKPLWESGNINDSSENMFFTRSGEDDTIDRNDLLEEHARPHGSRGSTQFRLKRAKGFSRFEPARAMNSAIGNTRSWWQKKGNSWPIFLPSDFRNTGVFQNAAQNAAERLVLNPAIIEFAKRFASQIASQMPIETFLEIEAFCIEHGLIQDQAASVPDDVTSPCSRSASPSEAATTARPKEQKNKGYKCSHCKQPGHKINKCPAAGKIGQAEQGAQSSRKRDTSEESDNYAEEGAERSGKRVKEEASESDASPDLTSAASKVPRANASSAILSADNRVRRNLNMGSDAALHSQASPCSGGGGVVGASSGHSSCAACGNSVARGKCSCPGATSETCIVLD